MKLRFIRDVDAIYGWTYKAGDEIDYTPWDQVFQGMTEPERAAKGIFVHCYGQGEFDVFGPDDVVRV